jgi:hypothetical protein
MRFANTRAGMTETAAHYLEFVIPQWDRLPACQAHRLEAGATMAAAREES